MTDEHKVLAVIDVLDPPDLLRVQLPDGRRGRIWGWADAFEKMASIALDDGTFIDAISTSALVRGIRG